MGGLNDVILIFFACIFSLGVLTLDFTIFEKLKRSAAQEIASRFGLYDVYFNQCTLQSLEMVRTLRNYEEDYCESLVDLVAETLSLPEMLLILAVSHIKSVLNGGSNFPTLTDQAQRLADFYIDVARQRLRHTLPQTGPHAKRLNSRWRRRMN